MDTPQFRRNPDTQEMEELKPQPAPDRQQLEDDVATAQKRKEAADKEVADLRAELTDAETEQQEAADDLTFRTNRLAAWDKAAGDSADATPEAAGADDDDVADPDDDGADDEDLADGDDSEPDPDEPPQTGTEKVVPIRRHASA